MTNQIILDHNQIQHIIKRIAYQIYETFVDDKKIILAGIKENGFILATKIKEQLDQISTLEVELCEIIINKKKPIDEVKTSMAPSTYKNQAIVLVDDVLNTGSTLIYAVKHFLEHDIKKCKTAVLINRNHKMYPIKADFKGLSLSTSKNEHVQVAFKNNENAAYLS
jgi:pyrimidine operon attenuation protein/uracil phosphoribosyltransferase